MPKYYSVLLVPIEVDCEKDWEYMSDKDFEDMDYDAYMNLRRMLDDNSWKDFPFRHYKELDDVEELLNYP